MTDYVDLLPIVIAETGAVLPDGFDSWGIKSVLPDLRTTHGYRWALPGGTNISNDDLAASNIGACPFHPGDGLCVATTWRGMASGGVPARTLLLVAYRASGILGRDDDAGKLRIGGEVASVALVDGERLVREHGRGADLWSANFQGANLWEANLRDANLRYANLQGANLYGADLRGTGLQYANLQGAVLQHADLWRANLRYADLQGANLLGADLQLAGLRYANLQGVDLRGANLQDADLRDIAIQDANLQGTLWPSATVVPDGWTLTDAGTLTREAIQ